MPEVSFTTVVRKAQTFGGQTKSKQDGDGLILICQFMTRNAAKRMKDYALEEGWHAPDQISEEKGMFYLTIFSPPQINYRGLLKQAMVILLHEVDGDHFSEPNDFAEDEWDAIQEIAEEIDIELAEALKPKKKKVKKGKKKKSKKT